MSQGNSISERKESVKVEKSEENLDDFYAKFALDLGKDLDIGLPVEKS